MICYDVQCCSALSCRATPNRVIVHTALQFRYGALIAAALRNGTMDQAAVVHARPFHREVAISCELLKLLKFALI